MIFGALIFSPVGIMPFIHPVLPAHLVFGLKFSFIHVFHEFDQSFEEHFLVIVL